MADEHVHPIGTGLQALKDSGMLWELNTRCMHPDGFELRVVGDQLVIVGDGSQVKAYPDSMLEEVDLVRRKAMQTRLDAKGKNNPAYHAAAEATVAKKKGQQ